MELTGIRRARFGKCDPARVHFGSHIFVFTRRARRFVGFPPQRLEHVKDFRAVRRAFARGPVRGRDVFEAIKIGMLRPELGDPAGRRRPDFVPELIARRGFHIELRAVKPPQIGQRACVDSSNRLRYCAIDE